jgi:hypothetical protein
MSLQQTLIVAMSIFCMLSVYLILQHEQRLSASPTTGSHPFLDASKNVINQLKKEFAPLISHMEVIIQEPDEHDTSKHEHTREKISPVSEEKIESIQDPQHFDVGGREEDDVERKGLLKCDGKYVDSEVIYWKIVPGDNTYESPITPHHDLHHDRYLTYEYDEGGWNNIRMSLECVLVFTHAMGRTLVSPPRQNLYLLDKAHKDKKGKMRSGMGFEDFFDLDLLKSHKGYHIITSEEFLAKEGVTGGLHGVLPPRNSTKIGGREWCCQ